VQKLSHPGYLPRSRSVANIEAGGDRFKLGCQALANWLTAKPEIVLFSHVNLSPLGLPMRALRPNTKMVVIVYGDDVWGRLSGLRSLALARADAVWSISQYTRDVVVREWGVAAGKVRVLPLCLTVDRLESLHRMSAERGDAGCSILTVARLDRDSKHKGVDHVIRALPFVAQRVPNVTLTVVGDGSDRSRLMSLANGLEISSRVRFLGAIGDDSLAEAYKQCDVFALPSAQEGFGLVYLEAMAAGKPVVAVDARATAEIVLHDRTGLLVSYGDVAALSQGLTTLLTDSCLRRQMGSRGRQLVDDNFTFKHFAVRVGELLNDVSIGRGRQEAES
jgi:glycosyltransferase involved in cell wall biosynthesis